MELSEDEDDEEGEGEEKRAKMEQGGTVTLAISQSIIGGCSLCQFNETSRNRGLRIAQIPRLLPSSITVIDKEERGARN